MTSPIVDFIEARLVEDQEAATASITVVGDTWEASGAVVEVDGDTKGRSVFEWTVCFDEGSPNEAQAEHIARHDPARVLREVAAKRRILDAHGDNGKGECETCLNSESDLYGEDREAFPCWHLKTMAAVYSDYPNYREEWKP